MLDGLFLYSRRRSRFVNSAFFNRKLWLKNRSLFMTNKLKGNVCSNSTFQVNRKKNDRGRRRLTSSNRAAILSSAFHAKNDTINTFGCKLCESTENSKALLFFSGKETVQTFSGFRLSHYAVVCEVINL